MNPRTPGNAASPAGGPMSRGGASFPMTPSPANPLTPASPAGAAVNRGPGVSQSHASPGQLVFLLALLPFSQSYPSLFGPYPSFVLRPYAYISRLGP